MMRIRHTAFVLLVGLFLPVTSAYAVDFYGADVTDSDVPSSYLKISLFGYRPIVGIVTYDTPAYKLGFQRGDIIFSINGKEIKRASELHQFTTDVLSISIFRCKEKMTLTLDRHANKAAQTRQFTAKKQSATQLQIAHDVPAAVKSPQVKLVDLTVASHAPVRREFMKAGPSSSRDAAYSDKLSSTQPAPTTPAKGVRTQDVSTRQILPVKGDIFSRPLKPAQDRIVFASKKGEVTFRHSVHMRSMNKEQCMLCHQNENITHESIQSRLDNDRIAHGFCRGCHQNTAKAPTSECRVCHT
jgi:membrane-associated protease RseP (regulator of RpoE activity)